MPDRSWFPGLRDISKEVIMQIAWWILVGAVTVASAIWAYIKSAPYWIPFMVLLGFLIAVGGVGIMFWAMKKFRDWRWSGSPTEEPPEEIKVKSDGSFYVEPLCFWFHPTRDSLDNDRDFQKPMQRDCNKFAAFLTGRLAGQLPEEILGNIDRLVLPDPNSSSLSYFQDSIRDYQVFVLANDIKGLTKRATLLGKTVKWSREFIGVSMFIGNPRIRESMKGGERSEEIVGADWIHIETVTPFCEPTRRPTITLESQDKYKDLFESVFKGFKGLWEDSRFPDSSEY